MDPRAYASSYDLGGLARSVRYNHKPVGRIHFAAGVVDGAIRMGHRVAATLGELLRSEKRSASSTSQGIDAIALGIDLARALRIDMNRCYASTTFSAWNIHRLTMPRTQACTW